MGAHPAVSAPRRCVPPYLCPYLPTSPEISPFTELIREVREPRRLQPDAAEDEPVRVTAYVTARGDGRTGRQATHGVTGAQALPRAEQISTPRMISCIVRDP